MKVIINAVEHEVGSELTYEQIAKLAKQPLYASCVYRTLRKGDCERTGILCQGRKVDVEEGMIFSIVVTGSA